ncbi:hypothetical protein D2Q93_05935 [Alicyclobacillaceae bacterium I2511]|nr:hypothetical protein D2Q93_05935 [Alicyclobacillaceae bacterium I2511]
MDRSCEHLDRQLVSFKTMLSITSDEGIQVMAGDYGVTIGEVKITVKHVDKVIRKYSLRRNLSLSTLKVVLFTTPNGFEYGLMRSGYSKPEAIQAAATGVATDGKQIVLNVDLLNRQQNFEDAVAEAFRCALGLEALAPGA